MSKYRDPVLKLLSNDMKSTNQILNELQSETKKVINWHVLYRILSDLERAGKAERIETKAGFFWRRK